MPPAPGSARTALRGLGLAGLVLSLALSAPLGAQENRPQGFAEPSEALPPPCDAEEYRPPAGAAPSPERAADAQRLAAEASEAEILGDHALARARLRDAARLDPTSPTILYRLGRLLEEADSGAEAVHEYCRFLALDREGAEADDVRERVERLSDELGLEGPPEVVVEAAPTLTTVPRRDIGPVQVHDPGTAFVVGMLVPGLGHFYSGRNATGAVVLGAAVASASTALLYRRVEIECLSLPEDGRCPEGQERGRTETRPLLVPGLVAAAAVTIGGALHAYVATGGSTLGLGSRSALEMKVPAASRWGGETLLVVHPEGRWGAQGVRAGVEVRF
jgi:hypothetical protein